MFLKYTGSATYDEETWFWTLSISTNDVIQVTKTRGEELLNLYSTTFSIVTKNDSILNEWILQTSTITIATADVLQLNATPIELIATPGAGKVIVVDKIIATVDYATTAYTTNTTLEVKYWTATTKVSADIAWLLTATADKAVSVGWIEAELVNAINDNIEINVATGEALAWDSDIKITVVYRILSI